MNRAFAAEFLAPSVQLRKEIKNSVLDRDEVERLAKMFGVSAFVIEHQLKNHQIAKVYTDE